MFKRLKDKLKSQLEEQAIHFKEQAEKTQADLKSAAHHLLTDSSALRAYLPEVQKSCGRECCLYSTCAL